MECTLKQGHTVAHEVQRRIKCVETQGNEAAGQDIRDIRDLGQNGLLEYSVHDRVEERLDEWTSEAGRED